jgi:hypothetical protein
MVLFRPPHRAKTPPLEFTYTKPEPTRDVAARLRATVAQELGPFARDEQAKKRRGEPYVDLDSRFEYAPTFGPSGEVAVSVQVGGKVLTPMPTGAESSRSADSEQSRYLVFTYALIGGRWVELAKPRWEVRERGWRATNAPLPESLGYVRANPR